MGCVGLPGESPDARTKVSANDLKQQTPPEQDAHIDCSAGMYSWGCIGGKLVPQVFIGNTIRAGMGLGRLLNAPRVHVLVETGVPFGRMLSKRFGRLRTRPSCKRNAAQLQDACVALVSGSGDSSNSATSSTTSPNSSDTDLAQQTLYSMMGWKPVEQLLAMQSVHQELLAITSSTPILADFHEWLTRLHFKGSFHEIDTQLAHNGSVLALTKDHDLVWSLAKAQVYPDGLFSAFRNPDGKHLTLFDGSKVRSAILGCFADDIKVVNCAKALLQIDFRFDQRSNNIWREVTAAKLKEVMAVQLAVPGVKELLQRLDPRETLKWMCAKLSESLDHTPSEADRLFNAAVFCYNTGTAQPVVRGDGQFARLEWLAEPISGSNTYISSISSSTHNPVLMEQLLRVMQDNQQQLEQLIRSNDGPHIPQLVQRGYVGFLGSSIAVTTEAAGSASRQVTAITGRTLIFLARAARRDAAGWAPADPDARALFSQLLVARGKQILGQHQQQPEDQQQPEEEQQPEEQQQQQPEEQQQQQLEDQQQQQPEEQQQQQLEDQQQQQLEDQQQQPENQDEEEAVQALLTGGPRWPLDKEEGDVNEEGSEEGSEEDEGWEWLMDVEEVVPGRAAIKQEEGEAGVAAQEGAAATSVAEHSVQQGTTVVVKQEMDRLAL